MTYKLLGAATVIAASFLSGVFVISSGKSKIALLEALLELVTYIRTRIKLYLTPVGDILSSFRSEFLERSGFGKLMRESGLTAAITQVPCELPKGAKDTLVRFASGLGTGYAEQEMKRCDECITELERICAEEKEKLSKNKRLYLFLPPLCALSAIILLL